MNEELLELLSRFGLIPLDWVSASQFSALTGINEEKLTHRRKNWQEDLVWTKQDGNIYYSIKGFNEWLTQKAQSRCQLACGSETGRSKSTSREERKSTTSRYLTPQVQKVSRQPLKLEPS